MILITVVDDRMGMCFNRRRLSRDRVLSDKILTLTNGKGPLDELLFGKNFSVLSNTPRSI